MKNFTKAAIGRWAKTLPEDTKWYYFSTQNCLLASYLKHLGYSQVTVNPRTYYVNTIAIGPNYRIIPNSIVNALGRIMSKESFTNNRGYMNLADVITEFGRHR